MKKFRPPKKEPQELRNAQSFLDSACVRGEPEEVIQILRDKLSSIIDKYDKNENS